MRYIILIGDASLTLDSIKAVEHYGATSRHDVTEIEGRHCVEFGDDHIFYDFGDISEDYEKDDFEKIPFDKPHFIMAVYTSDALMRQVLMQDNFLKGIYIDNDDDIILPIEEYLRIGAPMG